ncbi:MAG: 30S ribosomal protein S2 [bacterium]|nr:30S ribosomal protein S2 [bacterium]
MAVIAKPQEPKTDPIIQKMMEAGLHFGHRTSKTHPKMKPYITGVRNTVHIIDLEKTKVKLDEALEQIQKLKKEGKTILFVGTKVQQQSLVKEMAKACGSPFVTERWIGGTFTNFNTILKRIERLKELEAQQASGEWDEKYTKKEQLNLKEEIIKLEKTFGGVKELTKVPDAIFICDLVVNSAAVREAKKIGIPIIAISDTDTNPTDADYFIPANNDAVSALTYIFDKIKAAWGTAPTLQ